jgi:hypothetical protein
MRTRQPTLLERLSSDRRWWVCGAAALAVVALGVWAWWPAQPAEQQPRARQYLDFTACLLTDEHNVAGSDAAPVWAGMQDASRATRAKVQYVAVVGPQTVPNALTFLASLAQGRCDLIFAAGTLPVDAVRQGAARFPQVRFFVVGSTTPAPNLATVEGDSPGEVQAGVQRIIVDSVHT